MRNKNIDVARGVLMLYIVAVIHGVFWLELIPRPYSSVLLFEMPLIFLVSGYSFALFSRNTGFKLSLSGYFKYSVSRLTRLLVPYYGYSLVCVIAVVAYTGDINMEVIRDWMNPFIYGKVDPFGLLTSHLWFLPPFIFVTLALPFLSSVKLPVWSAAIPLCILVSILGNYFDGNLVTPIFYLYWTWVGYRLAIDTKIKPKLLIAVIAIGTIALILAEYFLDVTIDMQSNKLPPNLLFFTFSSVWVSVFLLISTFFKSNQLAFLEQSKLLKPFVARGYSIYLWQGIGYILAINICEFLGLSDYFSWGIAIGLTVLFGIMFSPLEKIRWRFKKA
ncbi:acyltransferase family protein [Leptolyngbya sp. Heron Island J]|uniref:acyltransferase family protein n=1 Tax=Leptolyngbya sp. Heron Island J TaxID=1385935 RepID=UPI0022832E96|nr:acyltransferase family protein [Leptolyngbya sp. Heron Island J]